MAKKSPQPPADPAGETPPKTKPRGRQSAAPECPYHKKRTKAGNSTGFFTRYYCPVEGCPFSIKISRPRPKNRPAEAKPSDFSAR